jgi:hypothetical protein
MAQTAQIDLANPGVAALTEEIRTRGLLAAAAQHTIALERTLAALLGRTIPSDSRNGFRNSMRRLNTVVTAHLPQEASADPTQHHEPSAARQAAQ